MSYVSAARGRVAAANGHDTEFSHDVIGILANLFTQGYTTGAHALLDRARSVTGSQTQYGDGVWTYPWIWAIYLLKTGDLSFVKANIAAEAQAGAAEPSIEDTAHLIAADRTGPGGIMEETNDIDANGYWTIDNYAALTGLATYRWLAQQVGDTAQAAWASSQYSSLLSATNTTLNATIASYHLPYLPCSMTGPNTANRCASPEDANWAAILSYQFMIANGQRGPYSWWESQQFPNPRSPWAGTHPASGNGSSRQAGGMANANMVLLGSLVAQWADGSAVTLTLSGQRPAGPVLFQLPLFTQNIAHASAGAVDEQTGTVTLPPPVIAVTAVTVQLRGG